MQITKLWTAIILNEEQTSGRVLSRHSFFYREQIKTTHVTRFRKLSLQQQQPPIISELAERDTSRKESHQSLSSLPTSSHLSPRPVRRNPHHPLPKGSPRLQRSQRQFSDLDIRNPTTCRQSEGKEDVVVRKTSRSNSLPFDSLNVDSLIDEWTVNASKLPNPVRRPMGSEHFEAVMDEMTMTPRKEGQGPNMVTKTVRISPLVQVTIGSPRLQPKKRNK